MCSGPHTDAVVLPQDIGHPGRVLVSDIQGDDGRTQSGLNVAVYSHARHTAYFFVKTASQCSFAGGQRFHALCQKPLYSGAKPGKAVHVQVPASSAVGIWAGCCSS